MSELAKLIAELAHDLPQTLVRTISHDLSSLEGCDASKVLHQVAGGGKKVQLGRILKLASDNGISEQGVGLALEAAFNSHSHWRTSQTVEMVWTGPSPATNTLRRTDQALLEVIDKSQNSLWIVSFAAYRMKSVIEAINRAAQRGVSVGLILESSDESEGKLSIDQINEIRHELVDTCKFYVWPTENREPSSSGKRGLLHAKCAVADKTHLFVSSANLTEAAMRRNIELGVLMNSPKHASQIESHITWLIESKILARI